MRHRSAAMGKSDAAALQDDHLLQIGIPKYAHLLENNPTRRMSADEATWAKYSEDAELPQYAEAVTSRATASQEVLSHKQAAAADKDADIVEAFVALGGNADRSGAVSIAKLQKLLEEFELVVDMEKFLEELDKDENGTVDYSEFKTLMTD